MEWLWSMVFPLFFRPSVNHSFFRSFLLSSPYLLSITNSPSMIDGEGVGDREKRRGGREIWLSRESRPMAFNPTSNTYHQPKYISLGSWKPLTYSRNSHILPAPYLSPTLPPANGPLALSCGGELEEIEELERYDGCL